MIEKKLLVNTAKGTAAWVLTTATIATPALLLGSDPIQSYLLGCVAMGVYVPGMMWVCSRFNGARDIANMYVSMYNDARNKFDSISCKTK